MDAYAVRLVASEWSPQLATMFDGLIQSGELLDMNLIQFGQRFRFNKMQNKISQQSNTKNIVVMFCPDFVANKESKSYADYCYFTLMKFKPWTLHPESIYGGNALAFSEDHVKPDFKEMIVGVYVAFMETAVDTYDEEIPGFIQSRIEFMRQHDNAIEFTPTHDMMAGLDVDNDINDDIVTACRSHLLGNDPDLIANNDHLEWDNMQNWSVPFHSYTELPQENFPCSAALLKDRINDMWTAVKHTFSVDETYRQTFRPIMRDQLRGVQVQAFDLASHIIDQPELSNRSMILIGAAGCGKSFVIDALRHKYPNAILVVALSGKAASQVSGETIHTGFGIPVAPGTLAPLKGEKLRTMRDKFANYKCVILDEYSMANSAMVGKINKRLQQLFCNTKPFGGLAVILVGDPGQLPPIIGLPLWVHAQRDTEEMRNGSALYDGMLVFVHVFSVNYLFLVQTTCFSCKLPVISVNYLLLMYTICC